MNEEYKKYKSSFAARVKWTLLCGIFGGCVSSFFFSSVSVVAFLCTCVATTTVGVSKRETQIRQFLKTTTYQNAKVVFEFRKKEKMVIAEFMKFLFFHCYMSVFTETGEKKYHLFFFSEEEFTKTISEIKAIEMKNIPTDKKVEIREELLEDMPERGLDIDTGIIRKKEKSRLLRTFCIYIGALAAVFLLSQLGYTGLMVQLELLIAGLHC